ncbi:hypothetical protein BX070DRAFT_2964 [Coemansia spiralis]|nr:hypothetical protein BX070DRAFT_2964 [Coemansia spiralis]
MSDAVVFFGHENVKTEQPLYSYLCPWLLCKKHHCFFECAVLGDPVVPVDQVAHSIGTIGKVQLILLCRSPSLLCSLFFCQVLPFTLWLSFQVNVHPFHKSCIYPLYLSITTMRKAENYREASPQEAPTNGSFEDAPASMDVSGDENEHDDENNDEDDDDKDHAAENDAQDDDAQNKLPRLMRACDNCRYDPFLSVPVNQKLLCLLLACVSW